MIPLTILVIGLVAVGLFVYVLNQRPTKHVQTPAEKYNEGGFLSLDTESGPPPGAPRQHPVLKYQREVSYDTHPASWGDPIRPPVAAVGPAGGPGGYTYREVGKQAYAYGGGTGPFVGRPLNVPAPRGALKLSSEAYKFPFYYANRPLSPYDYFRPYGPNQPEMQNEVVVSDVPFYEKPEGYRRARVPPGARPPLGGPALGAGGFPPDRTYGVEYTGSGAVPFISSVSSFSPFPEVLTNWEKIGTATTTNPNDDSILNLYRSPIAPLQDLFRYTVQDKNGFIIPLRGVTFLEDGDIIPSIEGKESKGPWKVNNYVKDKWVWN